MVSNKPNSTISQHCLLLVIDTKNLQKKIERSSRSSRQCYYIKIFTRLQTMVRIFLANFLQYVIYQCNSNKGTEPHSLYTHILDSQQLEWVLHLDKCHIYRLQFQVYKYICLTSAHSHFLQNRKVNSRMLEYKRM